MWRSSREDRQASGVVDADHERRLPVLREGVRDHEEIARRVLQRGAGVAARW